MCAQVDTHGDSDMASHTGRIRGDLQFKATPVANRGCKGQSNSLGCVVAVVLFILAIGVCLWVRSIMLAHGIASL